MSLKGKEKAVVPDHDSDSDTSSVSTDSDWSSDDSEPVTQAELDALLDQARRNAAQKSQLQEQDDEDQLVLAADDFTDDSRSIPPLAPSFSSSTSKTDIDIPAPAPPIPPPSLNPKSGKPLTKKEKKAQRNATAGPGWFDLPAPAPEDLPRMYKEVEALRLRNQLDPKRFYRKEEGEGRGVKGLPKYFAIGTMIPSKTPFGDTTGTPKAHRKRTLVDELVDDAEAKRYAKKKFSEFQAGRERKGRNTLRDRQAARRQKW